MSADVLEIAQKVIAGQSRSYVADALQLAKAYVDTAGMVAELQKQLRDLDCVHRSYCISPETYLTLEERFKVAEDAIRQAQRLTDQSDPDVSACLLEALITIQEEANPPPVANYKAALANLDAAQAAGTKLQLERQDLRASLRNIRDIAATLPGGGAIINAVDKALGK